jgi:hypothetical protein
MDTLSERLLQAKADAILEYKAKIGTLSGFGAFWAEAETNILGTLHEQMQKEQAATAAVENLDMRDDVQKAEFIKAHGLDCYRQVLSRRAVGV